MPTPAGEAKPGSKYVRLPQDLREGTGAGKKLRTLTSVRCGHRKFHFIQGLKHEQQKTMEPRTGLN